MAEEDVLLEHNYDGIQEYDNDLPRWWLAIFWITFFYSIGYLVYLYGGIGLDQHEQLAKDMKEWKQLREAHQAKSASSGVSEEDLLALVSDKSSLEGGSANFKTKCAACHGQLGEGLVGPNLTDEFWLHGGSITDIKSVIVKGVPEKGMVPWANVLSDDEINALTAYLWTIRGSNPPNAKQPQGERVPIENGQ